MNFLKLPTPIVSPQWVAEHLLHPKLKLLDASLQPITSNHAISPQSEFLSIPGAQEFDFDKKFCDQDSQLPHMMLDAETFSHAAQTLGINQDSLIVVYDRTGIYSSPRAWWMFKAMGHEQVAVLNGGLPAWLELGFPCQAMSAAISSGNFIAKDKSELFYDAEEIMGAISDCDCTIIDARSEKRFYGLEPEPRAGLRLGHIPTSINLPFKKVLQGHFIKPIEQLKPLFASIISGQKIILSCGSGVTACILALAATLCGYTKISVYDGSWSEWGLPSPRPVAK